MTTERLHKAYKDIDRHANHLVVRNSPAPKESNTQLADEDDPSPTSDCKYHTIRKGDTLGALAKRYGTTVSQLCSLNGLKQTTVLRIGKKIRVK
ncbi:MAG: LysM peptidoglycan-binding domain-containing protein [Bacteroidales bacterium]|nr:LysM peptidoglycan-binding domain-containing protein [Bacteroidales bacterium]